MEDEDVKRVKEKEQDMANSDSFGSSSQPQSGVKKKLKTLTFCRRRKGIKEVTQKRKSPWTFKFGPKVRDCSNTSVPIAGDNNTCVCTVYRRTDQASSADSIDFSKVDCLPKCVLNSKATKSHRMSCTSDDFPLEENHFSLSAISNVTKDERQKTLTETGRAASFETKESQTQNAAKVECMSQLSEFDQVAFSSEAGFRSSEIKDNKLGNDVSRQLNNKGDGMSAYRNERLPSLEFAAVAANESNRETSREELSMESTLSGELPFIEDTKINIEDFPVEDWDERARLQRAKEMEEGVDPPPGYKPKQITQQITPTPIQEHSISELLATYLQNHLLLKSSGDLSLSVEEANEKSILSRNVLEMLQELSLSGLFSPPIHTQVDYIHCLVPDLLDITSCSCYWGKMDRYEAETLLENKPEGTFLLRDSAQEDFLFSVSFQRYGKTLHARIEQWNHKFSFDSHDPGVFSSGTVCGLIEHYKDPSCCMYFDPMLTIPSHRTFPFSLQHLSRSVICNKITYDGINSLKLPKSLKSYLKEYHYKQRVKVRRFDY